MARFTSSMAWVTLMPRGQALEQLNVVRHRNTPERWFRISSRSPAAWSRESKMNRWALTMAAGPTNDELPQYTGHEVVHAAHRMHLVVSSKRSRSSAVWWRSL